MADTKQLLAGIGCGLVAAAIWGGWPVVSKLSIGTSLNAFDINALRFGIAGLLLLPIVLRRGLGGLGPGKVLVLAIGAGLPYAMFSVGGLTFAPASHGGIIIPSTMLVFSTIGGALLLKDRPSSVRMLGLALIVAGVLVTGWDGLQSSATGSTVWVGDAMFVIAGLLWATYTVTARAWSVDALHATALISVLSMVVYLPIYGLFVSSNLARAPLGEVLFQAVYQGVAVAILALFFYTQAVRRLGASRGAVFAALVPCIAVILSGPVLGEFPTGYQIAGVAIVTAGMIGALGIIRLPPREPRRSNA